MSNIYTSAFAWIFILISDTNGAQVLEFPWKYQGSHILKDRRLEGARLGTGFVVHLVTQCAEKCIHHPQCMSYNVVDSDDPSNPDVDWISIKPDDIAGQDKSRTYKMADIKGPFWCQLNYESHANGGNLIWDDRSDYYNREAFTIHQVGDCMSVMI